MLAGGGDKLKGIRLALGTFTTNQRNTFKSTMAGQAIKVEEDVQLLVGCSEVVGQGGFKLSKAISNASLIMGTATYSSLARVSRSSYSLSSKVKNGSVG